MAWVTYDLIEECKDTDSALSYESVKNYLISIGFEFSQKSTSHVHFYAPDADVVPNRYDAMWGIARHGSQKLGVDQMNQLYDTLTAYFEREAAREEAAFRASAKEEDAFPEWLLKDGYLAQLGVKLRSEDISRENGSHTLVLIDREFSEFSVRVNYDSNGKALTQDSIEGAVKKLNDIKHANINALADVLGPYKDILYAKRAIEDGKWCYQLLDAQTNDYITSISIPDMSTEDPAKRNQLLSQMLLEIDTKAAAVMGGLVQGSRAAQAAAAEAQKHQADLAIRTERDKAKRAEAQRIAAQERRAKFQELSVRLGDLGYGVMVETERDGKRGFIYRQSPDAIALGQHYVGLLEAIPETPGSHVQKQIGIATRILGQNLAKLYGGIPLLSLNKANPGERFVEFTKDEQGFPTKASIERLEADVKWIEQNSELQNFEVREAGASARSKPQAIKFTDQEGHYSVSYQGFSETAPAEYNRNRAMRYLILKVFEQSARSLELNMMQDDMEASGVTLGVGQDNRLRLQAANWNVDIAIGNGQVRPNLAKPDQKVIDGIRQGIDTLIAREVDKLVEDGVAVVESKQDGAITLRAIGKDSQVCTLASYDVRQHNLADILTPLKSMRHQHDLQMNASVLQQSVTRMESFGYCLVTKGSESYWHPPMDIKDLRKLTAGATSNPQFLVRRAEEAQAIIEKCEARFGLQQELVANLNDVLGHDAVNLSAQGISVKVDGKELSIPYAKSRDNTKLPACPLLNDDGLSQLKRLVQQYDVPAKRISDAQITDRIEHSGQEIS